MFSGRQIEDAVKNRESLEKDYSTFVKELVQKAEKMRKPSKKVKVKRESKVPNRFVGGHAENRSRIETGGIKPTRHKFIPAESTGDPDWILKKKKRKWAREERKLVRELARKKTRVKVENVTTAQELRQLDGETFAIITGYVCDGAIEMGSKQHFSSLYFKLFDSVSHSGSDVCRNLCKTTLWRIFCAKAARDMGF